MVISWDPLRTLISSLIGGQDSPWGSKRCHWRNKLLSVLPSQAWYILKCHWQFYCWLACSRWFQRCYRNLIFVVFFCAGAHDGMIPSFPIGPCLFANSCLAPTHELQKFCPGCNGLIHVLCSRVLEEDEGHFKADSVICPLCNPQKQQQQQPQPQP